MSIQQILLQRIRNLTEAQQQQLLLLLDNLEMPTTGTGLPPFTPLKTPRKPGIAKGQYLVPDDFDDPIDDIFGI